jgi:HEAT repeat protein
MSTLETIATRFARCVDLFRDPGAKEAQKAEFRALIELLRQTPVTLKAAAGRMVANGVPCEGKGLLGLLQRLDLHGVEEIALPRDPPAAQLFELLRALADQPGTDDFASRVRAAGADRIRVTVAAQEHLGPAAPILPSPGAAERPSPTLGTNGILHAEGGGALGDIQSVDLSGTPDPLAQLERNPGAPNVGDVLAALVHEAEEALKSNRAERVLAIIVAIARHEQRLPDGSNARWSYGIALRRICTKPVIEALARLVAAPKHRADATLALQRAGADAVEVLFNMLVAASSMGERRAVFDTLTQMKHGTEQLIHMLDHPAWFVVRNVAELLGELGREDAVPALGRHLGHEDERVRKAVALALAKVGSRSAAEPLRRALRDKSPDVRMQVALGIGGRKSSAVAMPLVVAMEEEEDEAVKRELILALGRIGSPDAVQALIKVAQPAGWIIGRKPTERRQAAVQALRLAASPAAVGTLEGLADDGDKQVRAAARAALEELKRKPRG